MRSSHLGLSDWVTKSNDKGSHKGKGRRRFETKIEACVKMNAEIGIMWPPTMELLEPSEAGRGKEGFSPESLP